MLCGIGAPGTPRFCALKERGWNLCCGTTHDSRTTKQPDVIRRERIHFADSAQCNVLSCPIAYTSDCLEPRNCFLDASQGTK